MPEPVDPRHLLLIGAGPGVGAGVVRRFGREGFRSTLISRGKTLDQLAPELRSNGLEIEAVGADIEDLDGYRATLERIFGAPGAPGVAVYNAALPDPGEILDTTVGRLRTAYDVDVLGAVEAAQVAAPFLRSAGSGTLLFTSGGFADHPVPALASLSIGKAGQDRGANLDCPHRPGRRLADRVPVHGRVKGPRNRAAGLWEDRSDDGGCADNSGGPRRGRVGAGNRARSTPSRRRHSGLW